MTLLAGLPCNHFAVAHADVPWAFKAYSDLGLERAPEAHYSTMSVMDIARFDVGAHMRRDSYLFFWVTGPHIAIGSHIPIMKSWGFEPVAIAFVWVKLNANWHPRWLGYVEDAMWFMGLGHTTRQNAEYVVLGRRGSPPERLSKSIHQIIAQPRREHSRKPDEVYKRIEQYADGPYLDLFGREQREKWTVRGNESDKFND